MVLRDAEILMVTTADKVIKRMVAGYVLLYDKQARAYFLTIGGGEPLIRVAELTAERLLVKKVVVEREAEDVIYLDFEE